VAGKVQYLLNREGRYFARLVIPKDLRPFMSGKTELRSALGPDYRTAVKKLPGAVALLQHEIALAERQAAEAGQSPITMGRYPLAPSQIALRNYQERLAFDEEMRNGNPFYARMGYVDEHYVERLRAGMAGAADDAELARLIGHRIERFRRLCRAVTKPSNGAPPFLVARAA